MLAMASVSPLVSPSSADARSSYIVAVSAASILNSYICLEFHLAARLLDRAALFLAVDAPCLRRPARPRRPALRLYDMGIGDHLRQPLPGIGAVRVLRAEPPGGDQQLSSCRRSEEHTSE